MDIREFLRIADEDRAQERAIRELQAMANPDLAAEQLARLVQDTPLPTRSTEKRTDAMAIMNEIGDGENE